jgi:hypothetical protein
MPSDASGTDVEKLAEYVFDKPVTLFRGKIAAFSGEGSAMRNATIACVFLLRSLAAVGQTPTPPPYCKPCLFYGGDFDPNNATSNVLGNSLAKGFPAATYVPFYVPSGQTWTIGGLFSNNMSTISFLDPPEVVWSISSGISQGNPGTVIASGKNAATWAPTGRTWQNGYYTEYTALALLKPQEFVVLTAGVYWMTAVPVCTNSSCGEVRFFISDVEDVPAPNHKGVQPNDDSYFVWEGGSYFFAPAWGPSGPCQGGCDKFSAGLLGYAKPSD